MVEEGTVKRILHYSKYKTGRKRTMEETAIAATQKKKEIVDNTMEKINELQKNGSISFPANYNVENAIRSAYLIIQSTKDKNNTPALNVCTVGSVMNALLNTAIMGLNPAKKQVYYIVYGNQLEATRSYFGTMAATKRVKGVKDIWADVVYEGDSFQIAKKHGSWEILEHQSKYENIDPDKIVAAYCVIEKEDGESFAEVMNMKQIKQSWSRSKSREQTVHKEFPDQMAKRTVINRACKMFFNTSDDSDLLIDAFNATGEKYEEEPCDSPAPQIDPRAAALNAELTEGKRLPDPEGAHQHETL